ncbi:MAG: type IV secretory system conjugative DNA transfer family protein [Planctomycetaceae bacterium]
MSIRSNRRLPKAPREDSILLGWGSSSRKSVGFHGGDFRNGAANRPIWSDAHHLTTIAPTGAGKGVSCAIPTLLTYPGTMIVLDVKGELYETTCRRRREMGQQAIKLDPFRYLGDFTDRLNPLDSLYLPNANLEIDCQTLAALLATGRGFSKDPFWELSANGLNSGCLGAIATTEEPENQTISRLTQMLYNDDVVYSLAVLLDTVGKRIPPMAYQEIAAFLQLSERETRPSVLATAQSFLKGINSARVLESLGQTSFSLTDFIVGKPMTIYLVIPPDRLASHANLLVLWIGTLLKAIFTRTAIPDKKTLFLIDECASLGSFPFLETAITLCRSYGVRIWSFWQDLQQLKSNYPTGWQTILNNSSIQCFGISSRLMAEELAEVVDISSRDLLRTSSGGQMLQHHTDKFQEVERLDYLRDECFRGLFDGNRYYAGVNGSRVI